MKRLSAYGTSEKSDIREAYNLDNVVWKWSFLETLASMFVRTY